LLRKLLFVTYIPYGIKTAQCTYPFELSDYHVVVITIISCQWVEVKAQPCHSIIL